MKRLVMILVFTVAASALALGQGSNVEQTVRALTEQLRQAFLKGDVATFDKLLADDFILISGWGTTTTKAEVLERLKSGGEKWDSVEISEMKVRIYGDTALVDTTMNMKGRIGEHDIKGPVRAVRVWVKRKGQWQCFSSIHPHRTAAIKGCDRPFCFASGAVSHCPRGEQRASPGPKRFPFEPTLMAYQSPSNSRDLVCADKLLAMICAPTCL